MIKQTELDFEPKADVSQRKAALVLSELQSGPKDTDQLEAVPGIDRRAAASIRVLRQAGWEIATERRNGLALYTLIGKKELVRVTEEMQASYYLTDHWRATRWKRMVFDGIRCIVCGATGELQVHHWKYDLFNESIEDLMTVCKPCHTRLHEYENVRVHFPRYVFEEIAQRLTCGDLVS